MKRIFVSILILLLMMSLLSCRSDQQTEEQPQNAEEQTQSEEAADNISAQPTGTVSLTDASWKTTVTEDEIGQYIDSLYEDVDTAEKVRIASLELFKALAVKDAAEGKNTMISPLSFLTAMGLLENGAEGDSLKEIETVFGMDIEAFNQWYKAWNALIKYGGGDVLNIANSIWFKSDPALEVSEKYLQRTAEIFDAEDFEADFDDGTLKDINGWVSDNTKGMIPQILDQISKDAEMFLINATCFEGAWMEEYEDNQVKEDEVFTREDGTEEKATMLYSHTKSGAFYENEYLTGTSKAYRDGFQISFLLPKEGVTVDETLGRLSGDDVYKLMTEGAAAEVDLVIPEFGFDYSVPGCIDSLKGMGIQTVFDRDMADLSPMAMMSNGDNLYVDTVIHKTHIELDREGTRAAASTVIGIAKATAIMEDLPLKEVRLDRPFIFVISDFQTMTPIFMGTVGSVAK